MSGLIKNNWHLIVYLFLSIFSIIPLLSPGFFPMHDDTQVARVFEMAKSLSHGMFPVRWVEDLGYGAGYPIFNFYSVLPYYIGGMLTLIGINALDSTKIIVMLTLIASGISMFFLVKEFFGKLAGLVSATIYLYFPYHALNIYVRGDLAEATAYVLTPLVFLGLFKIHFAKSLKISMVLSALSIAAVIISHNLSAFMLFIFVFLFIIFSTVFGKNKVRLLMSYVLILVLAFLLSAFYSLPAILEMKYANVLSIIGGGSAYRDHFVCLEQLWDSPWGFGGSAPGCLDGMSFKLGKLNIILAFLAFMLFIANVKKIKERLFIVSFSFLSFALSIFMTLEFSLPFWSLPFMDFLQFPWRFLNFAGLFISVISGYLIWQVKELFGNKICSMLVLAVLFLTLLFNARLFFPLTIHDRDSSFYTNSKYLKWTVSKVSDEYLPKNFTKPSQDVDLRESSFDIVHGGGEIEVLSNKTQDNRARINLLRDGTVRANIAYFPSWKIYVGEQESSYVIKGDGLYVDLPSGKHLLTAKFVQTPIEKVSNALSIIGLLGIIIVIIRKSGYLFYGKKTS